MAMSHVQWDIEYSSKGGERMAIDPTPRSAYEHWNEERDQMWYMEVGRFGATDDYDRYDAYSYDEYDEEEEE